MIGPIVVHLWRRHRAERVRFPSLRFVPAARPAALRAGTPSDLVLLLVRTLTILMAVAAVARPLLVTEARVDRWNRATARVLVVDVSESMRGKETLVADAAAGARDAEWLARVDDANLASGILRAASLLRDAPPARREIVAISDFQQGALAPDVLDGVPSSVGVWFAPVGTLPPERSVAGATLMTTSGAMAQVIRLEGPLTSVSSRTVTAPAAGLRLETGDRDLAAAADLMAVIARAGAPAADPTQPMTVVFEGAPPRTAAPLQSRWMWQTVASVMRDRDLIAAVETASAHDASGREGEWLVLFRDERGRPLVGAGAAGAELVLDVHAAPHAYLSAAVVRAALTARATPLADASREAEVERVPAADLQRWSRPAPPVGESIWRTTNLSDARWCWAAVLALMAIEAVIRRSATPSASDVQTHAA